MKQNNQIGNVKGSAEVKEWYDMMCLKTRDYEHHTTLMSEYCISDVDSHPCRECYYGCICKRCHLPFQEEDWSDEMCRECQGEETMLRHEEMQMEGL